jgi:hypothetical protein
MQVTPTGCLAGTAHGTGALWDGNAGCPDADITRVGDTLVFSPGAVCPWGSLEGGRAPGRGWQGIADRWVRRYRAQLGTEAMRRNVGLLEVHPDGIAARVIPLD